MNIVLRLGLTFLLLTCGILSAQAAEVPGESMELIEEVLDQAKVVSEEKAVIQLKNGQTFEFAAVPDREAMKESLGLKIPEEVKAHILAHGGSLEESDPMIPFESLSPERQQKFKEMRLHFLANAARILSASKFVFGAGSLVGDGFSFVTMKVKKAFNKSGSSDATSLSQQRSFQERSQQTIYAVLKGLDYKLWSQAPLVIDSNEFGVSVSLGLLAESGILRYGGGGAEEVGISFAFNKSDRAFVFEIFHNSENFDNTKAAISVLGVVGKAGFTLGRRQGAETLRGSSFYPPAVPGYSASSPEYFSVGFSSSLGLPPPPLADLLTFTNQFDRKALIRVTVSPVVKGFIRLQFGDMKGSLHLVAMRFVDVYRAISDKVIKLGRQRCGPVFN